MLSELRLKNSPAETCIGYALQLASATTWIYIASTQLLIRRLVDVSTTYAILIRTLKARSSHLDGDDPSRIISDRTICLVVIKKS